jgi:hypothetical protein
VGLSFPAFCNGFKMDLGRFKVDKIVVVDDKRVFVRSVNDVFLKDFLTGAPRVFSTVIINHVSYALPSGAVVKDKYSLGELVKLSLGGVQLSLLGGADDV